jgi:hypothetical protein
VRTGREEQLFYGKRAGVLVLFTFCCLFYAGPVKKIALRILFAYRILPLALFLKIPTFKPV